MKKSLHKTILLALFSAIGLALVTPVMANHDDDIIIPEDPPTDPPVVSRA